MRAAVREPDIARPLGMHRRQSLLQCRGTFTQQLRLLQQQIAAAVDADILQLIGVASQPIHLARFLRQLRLLRGIVLGQQLPRARVGMSVDTRRARPQEQRAVRARVEELPVVAGDHHRHATRGDPAFQHLDLREIEMVGRLIEQQRIGLRHPGARDQRQPLPAAAERIQRTIMQIGRRAELVEHDIDAPCLAVALRRWQRASDCFGERQVQQVCRHVLLDVAHAHAARTDDVASGGLDQTGEAFQQCCLAAAVRGDQPDAVGVADHHRQVPEQGMRRQHSDIAQIDGGHSCISWLDGTRKGWRSEPAERQFGSLASPATMDRRAKAGPRG